MHILHVIGARPNFMKVAPVHLALRGYEGIEQTLVHTGQHYDINMSDVFFQDLGIPAPDVNLQVGSGSHAQQTARIMSEFERVVLERKPDMVLVYGDVNSTVAAALVCAKLLIPISHVEAGLRSFDRGMPEEVNRLLTDQLCDLLFTPSADGDRHLLQEGIGREKIHRVGNVMVDTLVMLLPKAQSIFSELSARLSLPPRYGLVTLHRPSNVDDATTLAQLLKQLRQLSERLPLVFPIHPRTRQKLGQEMSTSSQTLRLCDPLGYVQFLALQQHATVVITDSGGIQEETTYLGVPCITMRENTERPVTIELGSNVLVGNDSARLAAEFHKAISGQWKKSTVPPLWDGKASERISQILVSRNRSAANARGASA
jgi:UDP-N-acetylglucosamine 2-epimerase (non-hydrolysing)